MPIEMPAGLPFAVDTWGPSFRRRRHCFLTHAHRDHLVGAGAGADGGGTIYATGLTLSLALRQFPELGRWEFVEMEVGKTVVVDDPSSAFSVTAYDANHCPGAVMFLFEGEFGSILHTGDCRLTSDCVQNLPLKYIAKKGKENVCQLAFVFLDCTFSKCFLKLPSKESAIQQVIACIWKHPHAPFVYLACDLLGHEDILIEVSRTFGLKIYVDRKLDCFKVLSLTAHEIITDDPSSRFQMVGFHNLYENASKKLEEARASLQPEPLFIRPSTQWYANYTRNQKPCLTEAEQDEFGIWHVCFSIHSSRDELEQALQLLQPQWVISTTPPCFAIELSYVRKHCFKTHITADDPLWKIFRNPLGNSVSSPSSVLAVETHTEEDHSNFLDGNGHSSPTKEERIYLNALELSVVSSPPPEEPDITLFGRARFASQAINIMKEELCNQYLAFEDASASVPTDLVLGSSEEVETYSVMDMVMKQVPSSLQKHVGGGEEVHLCQPEQSPVLSKVIQVQSLPTFGDTLGVADQREKAEAASESKQLRSAMDMIMKQVTSCLQEHAGAEEEIQVQPLRTVEDDTLGVADHAEAAIELKPLRPDEGSSVSVVRSAEGTDCQKEPLCFIGSSKCLNASLKRLYRSRNIPVPRPLPSLVRLLESSKRVKMQQSTNSSLLNSQHSFP